MHKTFCDTLTLRTDSLKIRTVNEAMGVDKSDSLSRPLLLNSPTASSPSRVKRMAHQVKRTGNIFYRFIKNFDDYDTTYISPNYYNFYGDVAKHKLLSDSPSLGQQC